ncbi:hypothetical protein LTR08_007493 [Meristemomyces frigidus]|nr:hypothetical protein LTR08_007493 [Meristemomyces frigidus]
MKTFPRRPESGTLKRMTKEVQYNAIQSGGSSLEQTRDGAHMDDEHDAVEHANHGGEESRFGTDSRIAKPSAAAKPGAARLAVHDFEDVPLFETSAVFDTSPVGAPSRAMRPGHARTESAAQRSLTMAKSSTPHMSGESSLEHTEDEAHGDDEFDDLDDVEHTKRLERQRRKQEANMAIYRQQMKKATTGGAPPDVTNAIRPSLNEHTHSAPASSVLYLGGIGDPPPSDTLQGKPEDDSDDDVPLGVLQAHGFPNGGRPPTRSGEPGYQRRASMAGSTMGAGPAAGNLPAFARRLPVDPYFGAGRESLPYNGPPSVYAGPTYTGPPGIAPQMGQPGGLVGIIAGEERAKAARRGSPNQFTGTYNGLPSNMPGLMPGMPRTMSMGSMAGPQMYAPNGHMSGMPPMPMMPQDAQSQQLQQFMAMQMQLMQSMLSMQQQMGAPQAQQPSMDYLGVPLPGQRPAFNGNHTQSFQGPVPGQGRAMTMTNPPSQWAQNQIHQQRPNSAMPGQYMPSVQGLNISGTGAGYTPSIAPSERSNIGMAPRYRPIQTNGDAATAAAPATGRSQSMNSSMTLQAFTNPQARENGQGQQKPGNARVAEKPKATPKASPRQADADEDDDEAWAVMAQKRKEKNTGWRARNSKLAQPALGDFYNLD